MTGHWNNEFRFVTFAAEADARLALDKIKNASLGGKPLRARLKTESLVRTYPRSQSGSNNSSPTYRPPQLVIDDQSIPSNTSTQPPIPAQSPQYYYPPMLPISPHLMNPNGQSPGSGSNTPQYPNIPGMYYMYPPFPNGFIPHPMHHPMGSPMYMGGVWMPPYPVMQMSPNSNLPGTPGQQPSGRGKHKQKSSPRSGQAYSPTRNSHNKSFNPKDRQGTNPAQEVPTSPKAQNGENQELEASQEELKDQENHGNKRKNFRKRRDRFPSQEGGQGDILLSSLSLSLMNLRSYRRRKIEWTNRSHTQRRSKERFSGFIPWRL